MSVNEWRKQNVLAELTLSRSMTDDAWCAYSRLILQYRHNGGTLKDDDHQLARVVGFTLRRWRHAKPELLHHFRVENDHLVHDAEDEEIKRATAINDTRREAGRIGGTRGKKS